MSTDDDRRNVVDYSQSQQQRRDYYELEEYIEDKIRTAGRALARGEQQHYIYVAEALREAIIPGLSRYCSKDLGDYDHELHDHERWDWSALTEFRENDDAIIRTLRQSGTPDLSTVGLASHAFSRQVDAARSTTQRALESAAAIAEEEDIVMDAFESEVDAVGFARKVGEHIQDQEMDIGDPVQIVSRRSGALKTLFSGGTGQGKSAALETEADDYYALNFREGRDMKILDLVGLRDGENWFADVPQSQSDLERIRKEMDLDSNLEDDRRVEILVPLTPGLSRRQLPYDTESEDFVVKPFTVPASDIRKPLLVSMITAKLTDQQESVVRNAYDALDRRQNDWTLADLAREIETSEEMDPEKRSSVVATLAQLQSHGFIRTSESEYTIDWREVFSDSKTITVFSQALMPDENLIPRLICFGYLAWTIVKKREQMHGVPECVLLMRELWKVAPHNKRQAFDNRAASLQEAIGNMLAQLFRENRHSGVHVLADTQQPGDLLKPVREMFNRYVIFNTNKKTTQKIFEWTANDRWRSFYNTLTPKPGEASVVGMTEPAIEERRIEFVGPIKYAPPPHHHRDAETDRTGWHARCKYLDAEELEQPVDVGIEWPDQLPTKLKITDPDEADKAVDPEHNPVQAFVDECIEADPSAAVKRDDVKVAFNAWAYANEIGTWDFSDSKVEQRLGERLRKALDVELGRTTRDYERAYTNIELNARGQKYVDDVVQNLDEESEPISGQFIYADD